MKSGRTEPEMIRVLVSDGARIHTQLLADALRRDPSFQVFTPASHSQDTAETAVTCAVDIAVISARIDEQSHGGLEELRKIRASRPNVRGVVLLDSVGREIVLACFRAGARGLFNRDASVESLSECVRKVHGGEIWATPEQLSIALEALAGSPTVRAVDSNGLNLLSKRELEVVSSLAEGLSNREIAARLGLSQHTIKNYLFRVFDKLGVSSRIELLALTLNHPSPSHPQDAAHLANGDGSGFASSQKAAEQGMPIAQMSLANMYSEGKGVKKDLALAYMWYLVCEKNLLDLKEAINAEKRTIAGLLTTEEILEAQKLAAGRQKKSPQQVSPIPVRTNLRVSQS